MAPKKGNRSELNIDENSLVAEVSIISRLFNAFYSIVLGIVLVQVFYFFIGSGSVVFLFNNMLFLAFLGVCSILGWVVGDSFIVWLKNEIGNWKFW